ncbi:MAG: hypothetical protein GY772_08230 [bacterium]|nr:hypothetical protein [bacterium]
MRAGRRSALRSPLVRASDRSIALGIAALAGLVLLTRLDRPLLWQDEAQTALLARSILEFGVPVGFDGLNSYSQELGVEYGEDRIWRWHPWLPFYLVAATFAVFEADTAPARLPFALCGFATVLLAWAAGRDLFRDRLGAVAGAVLLCLSLSFVVLSRQSRYYALATLLSLAGLWIGARLDRSGWTRTLALVAVASLLFHTQAVYAAALLLAILVHAALLNRRALRPALAATAATTVFALPWIVWVGLETGVPGIARFLDWRDTPLQLAHYAEMLFDPVLASGALLAAPVVLAFERMRRRESLFDAESRRHATLLVLHVAITILLLALLSPLPYLRYLAPVLPPLFMLLGLAIGGLFRIRPLVAGLAVALALAFGSLDDLVRERSAPVTGPITGIVAFLADRAETGDRVAIAYGDLPVKFYTGLRVVGGLTGEPLDEVGSARWLIPRRRVPAARSREVNAALRATLAEGGYRRHVLDAPDLPFENREDPRVRPFPARGPRPPVVVWEKLPEEPQ